MDTVVRNLSDAERRFQRAAKYARPALPAVARFLMVATFLEDSLRICSQWNDQRYYLSKYRGFGDWAGPFLALVVATMTACSVLSVLRLRPLAAAGGLFTAVTAQAVAYGVITDAGFVLRSLSVCGGLLMLLADARASAAAAAAGPLTPSRMLSAGPCADDGAAAALPAGSPLALTGSMTATLSTTTGLQLAGRVLLVLLFASSAGGGWGEALQSPARAALAAAAAIGCFLVVIGFKARWSALALAAFLCVSNVILNNWWSLHRNHPQRDFQKYDFFQNLSVMGGFLLLINLGPGEYSVDEKKKNH